MPDNENAAGQGAHRTPTVPSDTNPLTWLGRLRLFMAVLFASSVACLSAWAGLRGLLLAIGAGVVGLAMILDIIRDVRHGSVASVDSFNVVSVWSAVSLPFVLLGAGPHTLLIGLAWLLLTAVVVFSMPLLIVSNIRLSLAALLIPIALVPVVKAADTQSVFLREAQVRIAEGYLKGGALDDVSSSGVRGEVWLPRFLDGGSGVAYDPRNRLSDPVFASKAWYDISANPGSCELLYDAWYWCS